MPTTKIFCAVGGSGQLRWFRNDGAAGGNGEPGKTGARDVLDGLRPDRRQIEAAILTGFWRLDENADARGRSHPSLPAQIGDAREQIVGAFGSFDAEHVAVGDDHGLADVERTKRRDHRERARDVGAVARRRLAMAQHAFGRDNFRRDVADADEAHAAIFEQAGNARKQPIVAAAEEPDDTRQQTDRRPVEADLVSGGRSIVPMNNASRHVRRGEDARNARPALGDPMVGVTLDHLGIGPAAHRKHHRPTAAPHDRLGHRTWKAAAAANDRYRLASGGYSGALGASGCIVVILGDVRLDARSHQRPFAAGADERNDFSDERIVGELAGDGVDAIGEPPGAQENAAIGAA